MFCEFGYKCFISRKNNDIDENSAQWILQRIIQLFHGVVSKLLLPLNHFIRATSSDLPPLSAVGISERVFRFVFFSLFLCYSLKNREKKMFMLSDSRVNEECRVEAMSKLDTAWILLFSRFPGWDGGEKMMTVLALELCILGFSFRCN